MSQEEIGNADTLENFSIFFWFYGIFIFCKTNHNLWLILFRRMFRYKGDICIWSIAQLRSIIRLEVPIGGEILKGNITST